MKKRLISILLTLIMVMSMFTGMSVNAYADDVIDSSYYKEYTLAQGDYVLRICQKMGINYYTCKDAIMALNNITSENGFRYLGVGEVVRIPVSDAAAVAILTGKPIGSTGSTGSAGTADVSGTDSVAYYLMPYTMQRGDMVLNVCNSLGINFAKNQTLIESVNGVSDWRGVKAGDTILLPTSKTPAVGTTCYAVVAHKIASGEATYTICQNKGINFASNQKLMTALNPKTNFNNIKAGDTMYLPVVTTIKAASSTGSSTNNNNNTNNTTDKNNNTTTTVAKTYEINANINTSFGTMKFYADNKAIDTAAEGTVVTVDVTTKDNRAVKSLVVKYADGRADLNLESNSFIMPACDVRVDANIDSGYDIDINSNYNFKTVAQVGGINVSSATEGSSVRIVSTDPSYAVKEVEAYYTTLFGMRKNVVTVNSQFAFSMPDKDVTVNATLAPVDTYNFFRGDVTDGSFDIQVDGSSVSKAAKGAKVTIVWQPAAGYDISEINVFKTDKNGNYNHTTDRLNVYNNSFTMPASNVHVEVKFGSTSNAITLEAVDGGVLSAAVKGVAVSEADTGADVVITATKKVAGYESKIKEIAVERKADGHRVDVTINDDGTASFKMPAGGVNVSAKLVSVESNKLYIDFNATGSENSVTVKAADYDNWTIDDSAKGKGHYNRYAVGTELKLSTLARETHAFTRFDVYVNDVHDAELTEKLNAYGTITMPNNDLKVVANFSAGEIALAPAKITGIGSGIVSYEVKGKSVLSCKVGDIVSIVPVATHPHVATSADQITVIANNETKTELKVTPNGRGGFDFQMPADGVSITVNFSGKPQILTLKTIVERDGGESIALQGQNMWGMYINTQNPADKHYENSANASVGTKVGINSGDPVIIFFEKALTDKYTIDRVVLTRSSDGVNFDGEMEYDQNKYSFFMNMEDMTVTVYVKEKGSVTQSLLDISYPSDKITVGCTVGTFGINVVSTAKVGEIVYVIPQAKDPAAYEFTRDGITITKKGSDNVGVGTFTKGEDNVDDANMLANKYYPVTKDGGKVVGWKYIMPEGGVRVTVAAKAKAYDIKLSVKDSTDSTSTELNGEGFIMISTTESDATTTRQVANGIVEDVGYGNAVNVQLNDFAKSLYTIESITVKDVSLFNGNNFWMPAHDAELNVVLKSKNPTPTEVSINSKVESGNGKLQFYTDLDCKNLIANSKAAVDSYLYITATPDTGYALESIVVKNAKDNTEIATTLESSGAYSFKVPADGFKITAKFAVQSYTMTIALDTASHNEQVTVQVGSDTINKVKDGQTVTVPYGSTVKFAIADTTKFTLVDVTTDVTDLTVSKNASSASFKMPASAVKVTLDLNSK